MSITPQYWFQVQKERSCYYELGSTSFIIMFVCSMASLCFKYLLWGVMELTYCHMLLKMGRAGKNCSCSPVPLLAEKAWEEASTVFPVHLTHCWLYGTRLGFPSVWYTVLPELLQSELFLWVIAHTLVNLNSRQQFWGCWFGVEEQKIRLSARSVKGSWFLEGVRFSNFLWHPGQLGYSRKGG